VSPPSKPPSDIERLRHEYTRRANLPYDYSLFNESNLFITQQRQRNLIQCLKQNHLIPLNNKRILEVGCGGGGVLQEWLQLGSEPSQLYGIDLLPDRIASARKLLPHVVTTIGDGQKLPFVNNYFDIILQFTAFSSILDETVQQQMASDMLRVLKKDGAIIWYDFWLNPTNKQTVGIRPPQIRQLFPNCSYQFKRITLAPPITRRLVPISWMIALFLEKLRLLNTHYLAVIRPL
jgi:ubiquinone/menaquinone biosynthesis C-methylase UbiE